MDCPALAADAAFFVALAVVVVYLLGRLRDAGFLINAEDFGQLFTTWCNFLKPVAKITCVYNS